jgi:hypothetical protein
MKSSVLTLLQGHDWLLRFDYSSAEHSVHQAALGWQKCFASFGTEGVFTLSALAKEFPTLVKLAKGFYTLAKFDSKRFMSSDVINEKWSFQKPSKLVSY